MQEKFERGNPLNYKVKARIRWTTEKGVWYNCEGDEIFASNSIHDYDEEEGILEIPEWLYNLKFKEK